MSPFLYPVSLQFLILASVALVVLSLVHCTHYLVWSFIVSCLVYCSQGLVDLWTLGLPLYQPYNQNQSRCLCPCRVPSSDTLCRSGFLPCQTGGHSILASVALDPVLSCQTSSQSLKPLPRNPFAYCSQEYPILLCIYFFSWSPPFPLLPISILPDLVRDGFRFHFLSAPALSDLVSELLLSLSTASAIQFTT